MNVYQRIHAVMQEVEYLSKDDKVSTGKSSYKALSEEKATSAIRPALIKHGLVILPVEQLHERTDETVTSSGYDGKPQERINRVATVDVKYRIQNIDEPEDYIIVASSGTGVDTQDKGVGKAMTYAFKYMLLRTFAIPTGEDPDKVSSDVYTEQLTGASKSAAKYQSNVYDDKINMQRKQIKELVPDDATREAACVKRFGKKFLELSETELGKILEVLSAPADVKVTQKGA